MTLARGTDAGSTIAAAPKGSPAGAIASIIGGLAVFSLQDVIIKLVSGSYPISEVLFFRAATALPLLLVIVFFDGGIRQITGPGLGAMVGRGGLMVAGFTCYYLGIAVLPLASATAMFFTAPLFITLLSALVLREPVAPRRWLAVIAGFIGVALMVRPGSGLFTYASVLPLAAAAAYAVSQMMARAMPAEVRATTMSFHGNLAFLVAASLAAMAFGDGRHGLEDSTSFAFLFRGWSMPGLRDFALMMACGPIGATGLILLAGAYRRASASIVAPFEYTAIVWAIGWGIIIWKEAPGAAGFAGMALIAAAGLSIIFLERAAREPVGWRRAGFRRYRRERARREQVLSRRPAMVPDRDVPKPVRPTRGAPSLFDRLPGSTLVKGIACIVLGIAVFSLQDVVIKWVAGSYPVAEVMTIRSLVALPLLLAMVHYDAGIGALFSRNWDWLIARALVLLSSYFLYYLAMPAMPLAAVVALYYVAPLFITALAVPMLGEQVGWRRWSAIAVGFAGVIVMLRPDLGLADPALLLPVTAALCYASGQIITRRVARQESAAVMAFYHNALFLLAAVLLGVLFGNGALDTVGEHPSLAFLLRGWVWPGPFDLALLASCGVVAAAALWLLTQAYRLAPANLIAVFEYTGLIWATMWGFAIWGEVPGPVTVAGGSLVVAAGVYVLMRERRLGQGTMWRRGGWSKFTRWRVPPAPRTARRSR